MMWNPTFDWDREGWRDQAACRHTESALFFPVGSVGVAVGEISAAKAVCETCPVRNACLQFAFETNQESGIWGGKDEHERHGLQRAWRAGYRPPAGSFHRPGRRARSVPEERARVAGSRPTPVVPKLPEKGL